MSAAIVVVVLFLLCILISFSWLLSDNAQHDLRRQPLKNGYVPYIRRTPSKTQTENHT